MAYNKDAYEKWIDKQIKQLKRERIKRRRRQRLDDIKASIENDYARSLKGVNA